MNPVWLLGHDELESQRWGTLQGKVRLTGPAPENALENVGQHKDRPVCLIDGKLPPDDNLVVADDGGLRDVFVILVAPGQKNVPVHPALLTSAQASVELDNKNCRFEPHAVFVQAGQTLLMKNSDAVGHNCHLTTAHNEVNLNLSPGQTAEVKLTTAERVPGTITCGIHPWMDAIVYVGAHPYVAITAADGSFQMQHIPAGKWQFQFWHKRFGYLRKLEMPAGQPDRRGIIDAEIKADETLDLKTMKLPASAMR